MGRTSPSSCSFPSSLGSLLLFAHCEKSSQARQHAFPFACFFFFLPICFLPFLIISSPPPCPPTVICPFKTDPPFSFLLLTALTAKNTYILSLWFYSLLLVLANHNLWNRYPSSPTAPEDCPGSLIRRTFLASIIAAETPKDPHKTKGRTVWGTGDSAAGLSDGCWGLMKQSSLMSFFPLHRPTSSGVLQACQEVGWPRERNRYIFGDEKWARNGRVSHW